MQKNMQNNMRNNMKNNGGNSNNWQNMQKNMQNNMQNMHDNMYQHMQDNKDYYDDDKYYDDDNEECYDLYGWWDVNGNPCSSYDGCSDVERWAVNGVSADEACCVCGGGTRRQKATALNVKKQNQASIGLPLVAAVIAVFFIAFIIYEACKFHKKRKMLSGTAKS